MCVFPLKLVVGSPQLVRWLCATKSWGTLSASCSAIPEVRPWFLRFKMTSGAPEVISMFCTAGKSKRQRTGADADSVHTSWAGSLCILSRKTDWKMPVLVQVSLYSAKCWGFIYYRRPREWVWRANSSPCPGCLTGKIVSISRSVSWAGVSVWIGSRLPISAPPGNLGPVWLFLVYPTPATAARLPSRGGWAWVWHGLGLCSFIWEQGTWWQLSHPGLACHSILPHTPDSGLGCSAPSWWWPWPLHVRMAALGERLWLAQPVCPGWGKAHQSVAGRKPVPAHVSPGMWASQGSCEGLHLPYEYTGWPWGILSP